MSGISLRAVRFFALSAFTASLLVPFGGLKSEAQTSELRTSSAVSRPVPDRVVKPVDESVRVTLGGTVHPLAKKANDRGLVPDGMKLERLQVRFQRSASQEAALKTLIDQMHTPGSANYHKWLTPDEFGARFGPSDGDVAKVEGWLQSHGFNIAKLNPGRQTLEFSGTAGQFRDTFGAPVHSYLIQGQTRYSNSVDPKIPAALAPVFGGFVSLNNFPPKSEARKLGSAAYNPATHATKPSWTTSTSEGEYLVLAPSDFAVQYDLNPVYTASSPIKGDGQSIAIINESNINIALVNRFRTLFNLPANPPQVIIDGNDPGVDGINNPYGPNYASVEAYLDVEWAGAVAPDATVNLVIAGDTALADGLTLAAERAVYGNISPVMSLSFGQCELNLGSSNQFWSGLYEQAAAQGITVLVSSGDSGSAGCDDDDIQSYAVAGQAVNGLASTPYNVAVGGTDFYYSTYNQYESVLNAQLANYWNLTPTNNIPTVSLLTPVPEQPWNDSQFGFNASGFGPDYSNIIAGGGGASTCVTGTQDQYGNFTSCSGGWPQPSWQTGNGVPNNKVRNVPDVSLFASNGANYTFYPICAGDGDCQPVSSDGSVQFYGVGGTSASAPAFAGIMALVNEKYGRQGQAGYTLYPLAAQFPSAFHDVTVGSNSVPCNTTTVTDQFSGANLSPDDCLTVQYPYNIGANDPFYGYSVEGQIGVNGFPAYDAGVGYDLASGLGTIDAANLIANWGSVKTTSASTTTLTPSSTTFTHGTAITISGSVTPPTGGTTPTGNVALMASSTEYAEQGQDSFQLNAGSFSGSTSYLPGGTYDIWGYYPGDGKNPASSSTPVSITVSPEASTTVLNVYTNNGATISSGASLPYGSALLLTAIPDPTNTASGATTATGTIAFSDGSKAINTAVLNTQGFASYNYAPAVGSHSIAASFSGDQSYQSSSSGATSVTVTKATPYFEFSYFTLVAGQAAVIPVQLMNQNGSGPALPPTGSVTLTGGPAGSTPSAVLAQDMVPGNPTQSVALFTTPATVVAGTYSFTFSYPGDANYTAASATFQLTFNPASTALTSSITATASSVATSPAAAVFASATVTGQPGHPAPTGYIDLLDGGYFIASVGLPTSSSDSVTASVQFNSESLFQGLNHIDVHYSGDGNYKPSDTTLIISNSLSDFSLIPTTTIVNVPSSGAVLQTINVSSNNSFSGPVFLTCTAGSGITCSIVPSVSLTPGGSATAVLTVNTAAVTAAGTYDLVVTGVDSTGAYVHNIGLQVITPKITTPRQGPLGNLELAVDNATSSTTVSQAHALFVSGWAADPVDGSPLANVKVYVDGIFLATPTLNISRPDVATYTNNPAYKNSGFNLSYNASNLYVGPHVVEVVATDAAGLATTFGTLNINVTAVAGPPLGNLEMAVDSLTGSANVSQADLLTVSGWVADPADGSPVANVKVYIDGTSVGTPTLGISRPDVATYFHNHAYANAGFTLSYYAGNLALGTHTVTVVATDAGGKSTTFGPSTIKVVVPAAVAPVGNLDSAVDSVTATSTLAPTGTLYVGGWAADFHDNGPAKSVKILIDGTAVGSATLGEGRPDVASTYNNPAWLNSGFSLDVSVGTLGLGVHNVTAVATDSLGLTTTFGPIPFTIAANISTVAGDGVSGYTGDGGAATSAELKYPAGVAVDKSGNLYIADTYNQVIRKVTPAGVITTIAGNGTAAYGGDGGPATSASLCYPQGVAVDATGNVYIADYCNAAIRKVTPAGTISTVAGTGFSGYSGDGGTATAAKLNAPADVRLDSAGNLYIADYGNSVVRKVTPAGTISTVAGNGTAGYSGDGGSATAAELNGPIAVALDASGNLYIADYGNVTVRKVTSAGTISTYAGNGSFGYSGDGGQATNAELTYPHGLAVDGSGNVFISDYYNQRVREVTPAGIISTAVGNGNYGYSGDGGPALNAELAFPEALVFDATGNLYVAIENSSVIRKVTYSSGGSTTAVNSVSALKPVLTNQPKAKPVAGTKFGVK
jgi:sugar lactone lactonase YvrE